MGIGTGWAHRKADGTQCDSWGGWVRHQLEHKASQAVLGCKMGSALNFKHCLPGMQGHPGKTVAQIVALQRLVGR